MPFIQNNFRLTNMRGSSFELSSNSRQWIVCKIVKTITSLLVNQKFQLSNFKLSRVDCSNIQPNEMCKSMNKCTMSHVDIVYQGFLAKSWHCYFIQVYFFGEML